MKKVTTLVVILILLAVSVMPAMAASNQSNGRGNGNGGNSSQTTHGGNKDQTQERDQTRLSNPGRGNKHSAVGVRNGMRARTPFYLQGTITAASTTLTDTLTISLTHGNAPVKPFFATGITVTVPTDTIIIEFTQGGEGEEVGEGAENEGTSSGATNQNGEGTPGNKVRVTFDELIKGEYKGEYVAIHGNVINGVFTARLITVYLRGPIGGASVTP